MMLPPVAWAHVFAGDAGPGAGFMHPLTGPDHLLAMFSVGVLSAQIGVVGCVFVLHTTIPTTPTTPTTPVVSLLR